MQIEVSAQKRTKQGTGASRRLRRDGKVPGIVYGGKKPAVVIELDHNALYHQLRQEAFHASVLTLSLEGEKEPVLLRSVNMHPFRVEVQHIDFQRVLADVKIQMKVPLHFINAEESPAVKVAAAIVSHVTTQVHVSCLPNDLPEFVEVDLSNLEAGGSIHVSQLTMPPGVSVVHIGNGRVSDLCGALAADLAFAKGSLADVLERRGARFARFETLHDVVAALETFAAASVAPKPDAR